MSYAFFHKFCEGAGTERLIIGAPSSSKFQWKGIRGCRKLHQLIVLEVEIHSKIRTYSLNDPQRRQDVGRLARNDTIIKVPLIEGQVRTLGRDSQDQLTLVWPGKIKVGPEDHPAGHLRAKDVFPEEQERLFAAIAPMDPLGHAGEMLPNPDSRMVRLADFKNGLSARFRVRNSVNYQYHRGAAWRSGSATIESP